MYVERNEAGQIVGAWEDPQREGQELLPIDNAELQAFLAKPAGRWGKGSWGAAARWG